MPRIVVLFFLISVSFAQSIKAECVQFKTNSETHKNLLLCQYQGFWVSKKCAKNGCIHRLPKKEEWSKRYQSGMQVDPRGMPNPNAIACEAAGGEVEILKLQYPKEDRWIKRSFCLIRPAEWVESDFVLDHYQK
jgi:hypothetical protein